MHLCVCVHVCVWYVCVCMCVHVCTCVYMCLYPHEQELRRRFYNFLPDTLTMEGRLVFVCFFCYVGEVHILVTLTCHLQELPVSSEFVAQFEETYAKLGNMGERVLG